MGADIHLYAEKRLKNGEWATVQTFAPASRIAFGMDGDRSWSSALFWQVEGRFYRLFAKLAGVRGEGPAPRGIPPDASPLYTQYVTEWRGDGHSHSHCLAPEFVAKYIEAVDEQNDETIGHLQKQYAKDVLEYGANRAVLLFLETYCGVNVREEDDATDFRFVFFFDN
jgi:hypothetical protein